MAKVTSKLQLTIPKVLAVRYGIRPGDEVALTPAGEGIRMAPADRQRPRLNASQRRKLFAQMLERQRLRERGRTKPRPPNAEAIRDRGWKREDLYTRGSPR